MDFLDSLDLDVSKHKKSRRVRSWYLYEQFKALERNQLDAARQLKNRSYQDKLLQQELSERRARRKLYDQFGHSQSESGIERRIKSESTKTSLNASNDDFFESFQELQEDDLAKIVVQDLLDTYSQEDQQTEKFYEDDFKTVEDPKDDSCAESVGSVINVKSEEPTTDNANKYIEDEKETMFENIVLGFDDVKQKLHCLERFTELNDYDKVSDTGDSQYSIELQENKIKPITMKDKKVNTTDKNIYLLWSKLVSFASQVMQLNHGNCYHDYGSQFLTAVLACDVLRRGINSMCHLLQLYVSPIKFATETEPVIESYKNNKRRNSIKSRISRKSHKYDMRDSSTSNSRIKIQTSSKYRLENFWEEQYSPFYVKYNPYGDKVRRIRQPWRSISNSSINKNKLTSMSSYHSIWPIISDDNTQRSFNKESCTCTGQKIENPMLRLSRYLDRLMKDIDDPLLL